MSTSNPPSECAFEIINALPSSSNLITKTGMAVLSTRLIATAMSQELYFMNKETTVAAGIFILAYFAKVWVLWCQCRVGCNAHHTSRPHLGTMVTDHWKCQQLHTLPSQCRPPPSPPLPVDADSTTTTRRQQWPAPGHQHDGNGSTTTRG